VAIERVTWRDAHFDTDEPVKPRSDYLVQTVGWVSREENFLVVRSEKLPKGEDPRWRACTRIPYGMIISRETLVAVQT
jgi:hypothetical protein